MKQILKLHEQADPRKEVRQSRDIFESIEKINIDYDQENLLVFFLNTRCRLLKYEVLFKGTVDECLCDPKVIFRKALRYKAVAIIIAHNHPCGDLTPSEADIQMVKRLKKAGTLININFLDSVIFNPKEYYSMLEEGHL